MNSMKKVLSYRTAAALLTGVVFASPLTLAQANIAQQPLYLEQAVPPNVMFTIDDSGSMQFEFMPQNEVTDQEEGIIYMYPMIPSDTYNSDDYFGNFPTFEDDLVNAFMRSSTNNKIFYNPAVEYTPWAKSDGSLFPDADPNAAYWNPTNTGVGSLNLLAQQTVEARWAYAGNDNIAPFDVDDSQYTQTFWPIDYWIHDGSGSLYDKNSYTRVQIVTVSGVPTVKINGTVSTMASLNAITGKTRTLQQEIQNFANWFQYYRSRALLAFAGAGRAFSQQGSNMRVGFATINELSDNQGVKLGVRKFEGTDRQTFFDTLYNLDIPQRGTPLRRAMAEVGEYYQDSSKNGPWSLTPGTVSNEPQLACRQAYNVFMTDGYWNGGDPDNSGIDFDNEDGTDGPVHYSPDGDSRQYLAGDPYEDSFTETLADVAMYFWANDLRPDLPNQVSTTPGVDEAFWQHMVNFTVGLGVFGSLTKDDLDELKAGTKQWPDPTDNEDGDRIDDLFHAGVNSRGDFFSASNPTEFATALSNSVTSITARESSAAAVATNSTRLNTDTKVYQARFNSGNWTGQLIAYDLIDDPPTNAPTTEGDVDQTSPAWEAGYELRDKVASGTDTRHIITWNPDTDTSVTFAWSNLTLAQQTALNTAADGTVDGLGQPRLSWLRGQRQYEAQSGSSVASFRNRPIVDGKSLVLGDIVNSDPYFLGKPDYRYFGLDGDSGNEGLSYASFRDAASYQARANALFIGANDGMLHAFDAETGEELFAYVPNVLYGELSRLTSTSYNQDHRFYVDGAPRANDAYFNSAWHTVLVGGLGAGGKGIYVLDVTDPDNPEAMWEFSAADDANLGYTFAQPTIVRLYDDNWYVAVANGYGSTNGHAKLYLLDITDGSIAYSWTVDDTGNNGLSSPIPVDVNGDRITDYIYAGDLKGNLWKFSLENGSNGNPNTNNWGPAFGTSNNPEPLFQAVDASGTPQPITHRPDVGLHPEGGYMVYFGTGKYYEEGDNEVGQNPQVHTFYGIRDQGGAQVTGRASLQGQQILFQGQIGDFNIRTISNNNVDYATKDGWYLDLVYNSNENGERVVSRPLLRGGRIIFTTLIPSGNACEFGGTSWLMELDAVNGKRLSNSVFDVNGDGDIDEDDYAAVVDSDGDGTPDSSIPVSGVQSTVGIVDTPAIVGAGEKEYKYLAGSSGEIIKVTESPGTGKGRKSWRQLR